MSYDAATQLAVLDEIDASPDAKWPVMITDYKRLRNECRAITAATGK